MHVTEYAPEHFNALAEAARKAGNPSLHHRPFVDYYYATAPFCRMYLFRNDVGEVIGTIGIDLLDFSYRDRLIRLAFSTNYHALEAGVGGLLYVHWMKSGDFGVVFGGSEDTHKILRHQKWSYFTDIHEYYLNWPYEPSAAEPPWRRAMKAAARVATHKPLTSYAGRLPALASEVEVREEEGFSADMLPETSPFVLRFKPTLDYLGWRYATNLSFVRYRLFRILTGGRTRGYVVVNDQRGTLIVAQADADDARLLAAGILKSILTAASGDKGARTAKLTSSHREMTAIFTAFGFRPGKRERPWVLGALRRKVDIEPDQSAWLINFDIGDNGLRYPFLDSSIS
jgi:hypothetical protein